MNTAAAFRTGVLAALFVSLFASLARALGTPLHYEMMLGSLFTGSTSTASYLLGFVLHLAIGGGLAIGYVALLRRLRQPIDWMRGAALGLLQALALGLGIGVLGLVHPGVPELVLEPGFFYAALGAAGVFSFCFLQVLFGVVVGTAYAPTPAAERRMASAL